MYYANTGVGFGLAWLILHVVWWIIVIWLVIWVIRAIFGHPNHPRNWHGRWGDRSHEILRERYAKGEITKEQYESMKKDLESHM